MNVTVQRDFAKAVATVRHATDAKSLPILSHLLLEARDQQIRITGTDLSTSIRLTVPAEVTSPGALALPAHHLAEITHALPADATLTLAQTDEDSVQLVCGRAHYRIKGLPPADFPQFPGAPESNWHTLPARRTGCRWRSPAVHVLALYTPPVTLFAFPASGTIEKQCLPHDLGSI